ncbi:MAG: ArnT family glycosyltransferase [Janthinobacterium lividum]
MVNYFLGGGCALLTGLSLATWFRHRATLAMLLLLGAALLLRLLMAGLDPFLHDWDERFHAAVAHNLVAQPLRPALRPVAWLPYDYQAWCCNYIWLHKQPLFLWQMALSLKLFGSTTLALRLPSVLLSTVLLWPVYRLGSLIFGSALVGYLGALLVAFAYYQLEMVSGALGMDHNDIAFLTYVTASIWAYYEYRAGGAASRWLVLVGLLAGAAVLCKWLPGLLVYAGWGLDLLLRARQQRPLPELGRLLASLAVAVVVLLPWQLYTAWQFPRESAYELAYNARHFTQALEGHSEPWYFHLRLGPIHYGLLVFAILPGAGLALRRPAAWPLLGMVGLVYGFFTLAATKMYSYAYLVSPLLLLLAALALGQAGRYVAARPARPARQQVLASVCLLALIACDLRPWGIRKYHFQEQTYGVLSGPLRRQARQARAAAYRQLTQAVPTNTVVFNAPSSDEQAILFFSGRAAYSGIPAEADVRRLRAQGVLVATYPAAPGQELPAYLREPGVQQLAELPGAW